MSNRMWGGRFASGPAEIMEEINASIGFDKRLCAPGHPRLAGACGDAGPSRHPAGGRCGGDRRPGSRPVEGEIEAGTLRVPARARRHPHERREPADRDRSARPPGACTPPARATTRSPPTCGCGCATPSTRSTARLADLQRALGREGATACRHGDAGLHPPAVGPAGHLRPPSARLCRDARPRPRPLPRRPRAAQRVPARRRGARRHLLPDRPARDRRRRSASTGRRPTRSIPSPTATSRWRRSSAASICAVHLSRLAEEIVLWTSAAVRLRAAVGRLHHRLLDHAAEAQPRRRRAGARPRPAAIIGALHRPADRDEGPAAGLFEGHAGGQGGHLRRPPGAVAVPRRHGRHGPRPGARRRGAWPQAAGSGYATATDLADWLVRELGLPFREAHHVTGRLVGVASAKGVGLEELSLRRDAGGRAAHHRGGLRRARRRELGGEPHQLRRHRARQRPGAGAGLDRAAGLTGSDTGLRQPSVRAADRSGGPGTIAGPPAAPSRRAASLPRRAACGPCSGRSRPPRRPTRA